MAQFKKYISMGKMYEQGLMYLKRTAHFPFDMGTSSCPFCKSVRTLKYDLSVVIGPKIHRDF